MSRPRTASSRALSRGRAGLSAIRSGGSSKSNRSTRMARRLALLCGGYSHIAEISLDDPRRLGRRLARRDLVDGVHAAQHPPEDAVLAVEAGVGHEHDEELAVGAVLIIAEPRRRDRAA